MGLLTMASRRKEQQSENTLKVLRLISNIPELSSRRVADAIGISNGSAYYVLTALIEKGLVKIGNFKKNPNKRKYVYLLTPKGLREKSLLTRRFIERKRLEFIDLKAEIQALEKEVGIENETISNYWKEE